SAQHLLAITNSAADSKSLADLRPGNNLAFDITDDGALQSFEVIKSPMESFRFERNAGGKYDYEHVLREPTISRVYKEAVITDSLFLASSRSEIPDKYALELAGIFGGVVDFIQDTRAGDTFSIVYEERFLDDQFVGNGRILAAQFVNQGKVHTALRYDSADGTSNFYTPQGESMRKAVL